MDIQKAIDAMSRYGHLNAEQAESVMRQIMTGGATEAQIGAYLMALRMKGETTDEITGSARAMRQAATKVPTSVTVDMLDTCGTGGDRSGTFNISTTVAFVAAGAGIPVAKHGNRAASSKSGSADVLAALGVNLDLEPEQVGACIDEIGIGFLFAVKLHPAMRYAIAPRRQMGIRTIFNILGPLTNPAGAQRFLMGVFAAEMTDLLAQVLRALGVKSAMVVNGYGGLDELTVTGPNRISYLKEDGSLTHLDADPTDLGFHRASLDDLRGGEPAENAVILRAVLDGSDHGPKRDIVLLNAGAAIMAAGRASSIADGVVTARDCLDSGKALKKLDELIEMSQSFAS
ncbi:MAG: anthranilate phosphoribosyltransferase [Chloroflexi bacterium]|nr:anthranilate phosphoribosyltransferase [Chloroflexota bacterium]